VTDRQANRSVSVLYRDTVKWFVSNHVVLITGLLKWFATATFGSWIVDEL